jgi:hypothetical protein
LITLKIHHRTAYRYRQPVSLGPHQLMLRPRESRDLRLISSDVTVSPTATVTWAQDVFGNAVATATFRGMADNLVIDSVAELQLNAAAWPVFELQRSLLDIKAEYVAGGLHELGQKESIIAVSNGCIDNQGPWLDGLAQEKVGKLCSAQHS